MTLITHASCRFVQYELLWALAYSLKNQNLSLDPEQLSVLEPLIIETAHPARQILGLNQQETQSRGVHYHPVEEQFFPLVSGDDLPPLEMTQQVHTTQAVHAERAIEETAVDISSLLESLRNKAHHIQDEHEQIPLTRPDYDGSDRSLFRTTYREVQFLYVRAAEHHMIKKDDKDKYLPSKFLSRHSKWFTGGPVGNFFVDRMICRTFYYIAKQQKLNAIVLGKLTQCVKSLDQLKRRLFGTINDAAIASLLIDEDICRGRYQHETSLLATVAERLREEGLTDLRLGWSSSSYQILPENIMRIMHAELEAMQFEAIQAIYQSILKDKHCLTTVQIKIVERCVRNQTNNRLRNVALSILTRLDERGQVNYKSTFSACITQLKRAGTEEQVEQALFYIMKQAQWKERVEELFDENAVLAIINSLYDERLTIANKQFCLDIINKYLTYGLVSPPPHPEVEALVAYCKEESDLGLVEEALKVVLLYTDKSNTLPEVSVSMLMELINTASTTASNITVMILFNLSDFELDVNLLADKLMLPGVIVYDLDELKFVARSRENRSAQAVSSLVGKIIVDSLSVSNRQITPTTVSHLIRALSVREKQTRIFAAKALFLSIENNLIEEAVSYENLFELQPYLKDSVNDVSIHGMVFYIESLYEHALSSKLIPAGLLNHLSKIYCFERIVFNKRDFTYLNTKILKILDLEVRKKQIIDDSFFNIFQLTWASSNGYKTESLDKWFVILKECVVSNAQSFPNEVISILEDALSLEAYRADSFLILKNVIRNGQAVNQAMLEALKAVLLQDEDEALREEAFECLAIADLNQDLPESIFCVLELEKLTQVLNDSPDEPQLWEVLEQTFQVGERPTLNVFNLLVSSGGLIDKKLHILKQIILNHCSIPQEVIKFLIDQYHSSEDQTFFIEIFLALEKNHQALPNTLLLSLEDKLDNPSVLSVFLLKAQRGDVISTRVIDSIFNLFSKEQFVDGDSGWLSFTWTLLGLPFRGEEPLMSQESDFSLLYSDGLAAIYAFLQKRENAHYSERAEHIFIQQLNLEDRQTVSLCLRGLILVSSYHALSTETISKLIDFAAAGESIHIDLLKEIFEYCTNLTAEQLSVVQMVRLSDVSDEECLTQLESLDRCFFCQAHFIRLHKILLRREDLQARILHLLSYQASNLKEMPDQLVISLMELRSHSILRKTKKLAQAVIDRLSEEENIEFNLEGQSILLDLEDKIESLRAFLSQKISEWTVSQYWQLLDTLTPEEVPTVLTMLCRYLSDNEISDDSLLLVLKTFVFYLQSQIDSGSDISSYREFFLNNLQCRDEFIRNICFQGLRLLQNNEYDLPDFSSYCEEITQTLEAYREDDCHDIELLETLVSLRYVSFPVGQSKAEWIKGLILSDWAAKWSLKDVEKNWFFEYWSIQGKNFGDANFVLRQLHTIKNLSFHRACVVIELLPSLDGMVRESILSSPKLNYCLLRKTWLAEQLAKKISLEAVDRDYLNPLLDKMAVQLPVNMAEKLITLVNLPEALSDLNGILKLLSDYPFLMDELNSNLVTLGALKATLQASALSHCFKLVDQDILKNDINLLLDNGWQFESLSNLLEAILVDSVSSYVEENLFHVLHLMAHYQFSPRHEMGVREILSKEPPAHWLAMINQRVLKDIFIPDVLIKSPTELIADLRQENQSNEAVSALIEDGLLADLEYLAGHVLPVSHWTKEDILIWSHSVRSNRHYFDDCAHLIEALAVIKHANYLVTGFQLSNPQILASLLTLKPETDLGRLIKLRTGSGKTAVISVVAIVQALQNKKVDIPTSSPVEAERCAREQSPLYHLFGLTVADNLDRSSYIAGPKKCYTCDIVYGSMPQFSFDTLRDEYHQLDTRAKRGYGVVIMDEVDRALIDDSTQIAKLASPVAGLDQLNSIYYFLTIRFKELAERVQVVNGVLYYFYGKVSYQDDSWSLTFQDEEGEVNTIPDLAAHLDAHPDISKIGQTIENKTPNEFIEDALNLFLDELLESNALRIPANFSEYFNLQRGAWIKNLSLAYSYFQEQRHYLVQNESVIPVACDSNGTLQAASQWGDGLHQFLQIKHNMPVTPETLTTAFLSNSAYLTRYGRSIYGFTGTLGSESVKEALARVYRVDCVEIPSQYPKRYYSLAPCLVSGQAQWMRSIYFEAIHEVKKSRSVLIICRTIAEVLSLERFIKGKNRSATIKTYVIDGCDQEKEIENALPGEIIIATTIGGRGMDIKANALNSVGGLHVILTFMTDVRNTEQALARTARQNNFGTSREIVNEQDCFKLGYQLGDLDDLNEVRQRYETKQLSRLFKSELPQIATKDNLFHRFQQLVRKVRQDIREKSRGFYQDAMDAVVSSFSYISASAYENAVIHAMEERWAIFLKKINRGLIAEEAINDKFELLISEMEQDYEGGQLIHNPCHHIVLANDFLARGLLDQAMRYYDEAIDQDKSFSTQAFVGKAEIYLKTCQSEGSKNYKHLAIDAFEEAKWLAEDEVSQLEGLLILIRNQGVSDDTPLTKQLMQEISLLGSYRNSIKACIQRIKQSQRLITLSEYFDEEEENSEQVTYFDLEKISGHPLLDSQSDALRDRKAKSYDIAFHDLTRWEDVSVQDQAMETLSAAFSGDLALSERDSRIGILLSEVDLALMKGVLNPDITWRSLNRAEALEKITEHTSMLHRLSGGVFNRAMINLIIFRNGEVINTRKGMRIGDAKQAIKDCGDDVQIELTYRNANKNIHSLKLEFFDLSLQEARARLERITSETIELELTGSKADLLNIIEVCSQRTTIQLVQIKDRKSRCKAFTRQEALNAINEAQEDGLVARVDYSKEVLDAITPFSETVTINLTFNTVEVPVSLAGLESGVANVTFSNLTQSSACLLINDLREQQLPFALQFGELPYNVMEAIASKASLIQEDMEVSQVRLLEDLFPENNQPRLELSALSLRGIERLLELNEKSFIPWRGVLTISSLATMQMLVGSVLVSTGFGAPVGTALITEGTSDLAMALQVSISRCFVFQEYMKQKAVSLAISGASLGWSSLRNAGRGVSNLVGTGVSQEIAEQAATRTVMEGRSVATAVAENTKLLWQDALSYLGVSVAEAGGREILNHAVHTLSHTCMAHYRGNILSAIRDRVNTALFDSSLTHLVRKLYALDAIAGSQVLTDRVNFLVSETINPRHSFWQEQWRAIGSPLCHGILSAPQYLGSPYSMGLRIAGILQGLETVVFAVNHFRNQLLQALKQVDKDLLSMPRLLEMNCDLASSTAIGMTSLLSEQGVVFDFPQITEIDLSAIEFGQYDEHKLKVIAFVRRLQEAMSSVEVASFNDLVVQGITDQIIYTTEAQLISPVTNAAVAGFVNLTSASVQNRIIRSQLKSREERLVEELNDLATKEDEQSTNRLLRVEADLIEVVQLLGLEKEITVPSLINDHARKKMVAYTRASAVTFFHPSESVSAGAGAPQPVAESVEQYAQLVEGGAPANMTDIQALASYYNLELHVVDNSSYQLTLEQEARGVKVIVFIKEQREGAAGASAGHWMLKDKEGDLVEIASDNDDCGYAVISKLLNDQGRPKSVAQVRRELAQSIRENSQGFYPAIEAQGWMRGNYPVEANYLLFVAGKREKKYVLRLGEPELQATNDTFNATYAVYDKSIKETGDLVLLARQKTKKYKVAVGIYRNRNNGRIIVAIEGTVWLNRWGRSAWDSAPIFTNNKPFCTEECKKVVEELLSKYTNSSNTIIFTGHSKGALLASIMSDAYGHPAIVYDNPGCDNKNYRFSNVISIQAGSIIEKTKGKNVGARIGLHEHKSGRTSKSHKLVRIFKDVKDNNSAKHEIEMTMRRKFPHLCGEPACAEAGKRP